MAKSTKRFFTKDARVFVQGKCLKIGSEIDGSKVGPEFLKDLKARGFLEVRDEADEIKEPEPDTVKVDDTKSVKKGKAYTKTGLKGMSLAALLELCAENNAPTEFSSSKECVEFLTKNK